MAEQRDLAAIRSKVGTRLVVDHDDVIRGIRDRNPKQAREAMENHMARLISDVDHYWEQVFSHDHA